MAPILEIYPYYIGKNRKDLYSICYTLNTNAIWSKLYLYKVHFFYYIYTQT